MEYGAPGEEEKKAGDNEGFWGWGWGLESWKKITTNIAEMGGKKGSQEWMEMESDEERLGTDGREEKEEEKRAHKGQLEQ